MNNLNNLERAEQYLDRAIKYWQKEKDILKTSEKPYDENSEYLEAVNNELFWGKLLKSNLETAKNSDPGKVVADQELAGYIEVYLGTEQYYSNLGRTRKGP